MHGKFLRTYLRQHTVIGTMTIVHIYSIEKFKIILVLPSVQMSDFFKLYSY